MKNCDYFHNWLFCADNPITSSLAQSVIVPCHFRHAKKLRINGLLTLLQVFWSIIYMQYRRPSLCTLIYAIAACRHINAFLQHLVVHSLTYFFYSIIYSMQLKNLNCITNYTKLLLCTSLFKFVKRYK